MEKDIANKGFSLVELVVVIAVLAILSAVAIPAFFNVRNNAKVSATKNSLANIIKECITAEAMLGEPATFNDIPSWDTTNSFGDRKGLSFGFTYDTAIDSNAPVTGTDFCLRIAAKSNTKDLNGSAVPMLPHFEIFLDPDDYKVKKNCSVPSIHTINRNYCSPSSPEGNQW